jgi:hypothetical protein
VSPPGSRLLKGLQQAISTPLGVTTPLGGRGGWCGPIGPLGPSCAPAGPDPGCAPAAVYQLWLASSLRPPAGPDVAPVGARAHGGGDWDAELPMLAARRFLMERNALVALVAVAALGVGFYAGLGVGESRAPRTPERGTAEAPLTSTSRLPSIAVDQLAPRRLLASDQRGLHESLDGGNSWDFVGDAEDLRAHPWKLAEPRSK